MLTLFRGLDRRYFSLFLVCPPDLLRQLEPDLPGDVRCFGVDLTSPTAVRAGVRLVAILRKYKVQILHSHLFCASLFASPLAWLCRIPVIIETPHVRERWRRSWFKTCNVVDRCIARFVDYHIAVSAANAHYLVEGKKLPASKVVVIHNGCDVRGFSPAHQAPAGLKRSLGFAESDPVLIAIGRLEPQKGHGTLLEAFSLVRQQFPQARLVCLGEGVLRSRLLDQAHALGFDGSVRFVGQQTNVADWLALADISVLSSFYEGLPLSVIESLACAKPVVATAVDGTPEVVVNEKTGLTVPPGDARRLADSISRLLRSPDLRHAFGLAGRQRVLDHFTQERQVRETEKLYVEAWEKRIGTTVLPQGATTIPEIDRCQQC